MVQWLGGLLLAYPGPRGLGSSLLLAQFSFTIRFFLSFFGQFGATFIDTG